MIGTRTPYRLSFVGGGTDLPAFCNEEPGVVISVTIAKYVYFFLHPYHDETKHLIKYSRTELVESIEAIQHPLVRCALKRVDLPGLDINAIADIPAGTGLGSSSSFAVGLLHALYAQAGKFVSKEQLASEASHIEMVELGEPIGKQDQYAAAYGGFNKITFLPTGMVKVEPIPLGRDAIDQFRRHIMIFYTGQSRNARTVLRDQMKYLTSMAEKRLYLRSMRDLTDPFLAALICGDMRTCGEILHESWQKKKELADGISNESIDRYYETALATGAIGGKLLGAGGGGFLLFIVDLDKRESLRRAMAPLKELDFNFDFFGSSIIFVEGGNVGS